MRLIVLYIPPAALTDTKIGKNRLPSYTPALKVKGVGAEKA